MLFAKQDAKRMLYYDGRQQESGMDASDFTHPLSHKPVISTELSTTILRENLRPGRVKLYIYVIGVAAEHHPCIASARPSVRKDGISFEF